MMLKLRTLGRRLAAEEEGQALAEFALIMPMLFLLIAGILGFGRAWNLQQVVVDAAREGARVAVVRDTTIAPNDSTLGVKAVKHAINMRLKNAAVDTTTATITITGHWRPAPTLGRTPLTVAVNVPYALPLLSVLMGWATGTPNFQLHSTTTMQSE